MPVRIDWRGGANLIEPIYFQRVLAPTEQHQGCLEVPISWKKSLPPNVIVPKLRTEILRPDFPKNRVSIAVTP